MDLRLNLNYEVMTSPYLSVKSDFMFLVMIGPPGAGKGTQAKFLVEKINGFQISTGNMLRLEIQKNSQIGKEIINYLNNYS